MLGMRKRLRMILKFLVLVVEEWREKVVYRGVFYFIGLREGRGG